MTIAVGDQIPDVQLKMVGPRGSEVVSTGDILGKGRVVLFGVPAAFSPRCSDVHLPGFVLNAGALAARGVDKVFCVAVNDAYVMAAWGRSQAVGDKVTLLADGNGELTKAMGLELDMSRSGMGTRGRRYAIILDDGVVSSLLLEETSGLEVSSASDVLAALDKS